MVGLGSKDGDEGTRPKPRFADLDKTHIPQEIDLIRKTAPWPAPFLGDRGTFAVWLLAVRGKLQTDGPRLGDMRARFYIIFLNLSIEVQNKVRAFVEKGEEDGEHRPSSLLGFLHRLYEDPGRREAAKAGLRLCKQAKGEPFGTYYPRFETLLWDSEVPWGDETRIFQLEGILNAALFRLLVGRALPQGDYYA